MAPDIADDPPSFGWVFERLEMALNIAEEVMENSTEFYEKRIADALMDLKFAVEDIAIILRDHLACHDCPEVTDAARTGTATTAQD